MMDLTGPEKSASTASPATLLPYPGLRPFTQDEWQLFFGREVMVDDAIKRLLRRRLLVVHGDSGSGKSSLIYAGVLPTLHERSQHAAYKWRICSAVPGRRPFANLVDAFAD